MKKYSKWILLIIIYISFIGLGLPNGVMGAAWPMMRSDMGLPLDFAGVITSTLLIVNTMSNAFSGGIIKKMGSGKVTLIGAILSSIGLLGFAFSPNVYFLIAFQIPFGIGRGGIDPAVNLYVANNYSSKHMSWLHCFWGAGATCGTLVMSFMMAKTNSWKMGYLVLGIIQIVITLFISYSFISGFWVTGSNSNNDINEDVPIKKQELWLGKSAPYFSILLFFLFSSVEYTLSIWGTSVLVESRGILESKAAIANALFFGGLMSGRLLGGWIVEKIGTKNMIRCGFCIAAFGILVSMTVRSYIPSMLGIMTIGLGTAPIFPCLMHQTPLRFEKSISDRLVGFQIAAASVSGVIVTSVVGIILERVSLELLFPILFLLLIIAFTVSELLNRTKAGSVLV